MANPPINIPPFNNVPASGSPIRSDWPQQITNAFVAIDSGVRSGWTFVAGTTSVAPAGGRATITYGAGVTFVTAPTVLVCNADSSKPALPMLDAGTTTVSQFGIFLMNQSFDGPAPGALFVVNWLAVGKRVGG
jgi:hypothetical protein